jgi:2-oxoglutarate ferredoxin oxidoreductase subunit alpha
MPQAEVGIISFGSTLNAIEEARHLLHVAGLNTDFLQVRAVPFVKEIEQFIRSHERCYVVEMNRDGQLHQLLTLDYPDLCTRLISIAYTDGLPLTARLVCEAVLSHEEK